MAGRLMLRTSNERVTVFGCTRRARPLVRCERGDGLVEFALAATVFFMTIFGILEFGQAVFRYNMMANLAQEGARRAIVCGNKKVITDCDIRAFVVSRSVGLLTSNSDVTCGSGDTTCSGIASKAKGETVTVTVQKSFTPFVTIIPHFTIPMSATANMTVAR